MGVVMVGMVMNLIPIVLNGGMPVRAEAIADGRHRPSVDERQSSSCGASAISRTTTTA